MEGLAALSLASAVVQLIDFGSRVFTTSAEIRGSVACLPDEIVDLEATIKDLECLVDRFRISDSTLRKNISDSDKKLSKLAQECERLAKDLLRCTTKIKGAHNGQSRRWRTLLQAFRTVLRDDEIKTRARQIESFKSKLILHLVNITRDEQSSLHKTLSDHVRASQEANIQNADALSQVRKMLLDQAAERSKDLQTQEQSLKKLDGRLEATKEAQEAKDSRLQQSLHLILQAIETTDKACRDASICHRLISSLHFSELPMRHDQIPEAYRSSFSWITEDAPFRPWLERSSGVFRVSGKAGSGKSTLMKYLAEDSKTKVALETWAGDFPLVRASHFFWASGWPVQRSQEGLLRSLLCQIFRQCPELIPRVFTQKELERYDPSMSAGFRDMPWNSTKLLSTLVSIVAMEDVKSRFCFFIDGLDEYDGDHFTLIQTFAHLITSPAVKICVSSRPWNVFRKAYDGRPDRFLVLQDLTSRDIDIYIRGTLQQDPRFEALAADDASAHSLIDEIRLKSDGVFLWVFIVVRSLLRGLSDDDDMDILLKRLREIPGTLEKYFDRMLHSLDRIYQQYTAYALLGAFHAGDPLPLLSFWFLQLEVQDPAYALNADHKPLTPVFFGQKCRVATSNVNKWCRDLLEVIPGGGTAPVDDYTIFGRQVVFLHRTVRDYLQTTEVMEMLYKFAGPKCEPDLVVVRMFLRHAKTIPAHSSRSSDELDLVAARLMRSARLYEEHEGRTCTDLILALDVVGRAVRPTQPLSHWTDFSPYSARQHFTALPREHWSILDVALGQRRENDVPLRDKRYAPSEVHTQKSVRLHRKRNLLAYAVEFNLLLFVEEWLRSHPADITKMGGAPLLYHALSPAAPVELLGAPLTGYRAMVELLLGFGSDSNAAVQSWDGDTVWEKLVRSIFDEHWVGGSPVEDSFYRRAGGANSGVRMGFLKQDDPHARMMFAPLSEWLGDTIARGPPSTFRELIPILEAMLHHGADTECLPVLQYPCFRKLVHNMCQKCAGRFLRDHPLTPSDQPARSF